MNEQQRIEHLVRRIGVGFSPKTWEATRDMSWEAATNYLLQGRQSSLIAGDEMINTDLNPRELRQMSQKEKQELKKEAVKKVGKLAIDWVSRLSDPEEDTLLERMTIFWHGHFACDSRQPKLAFNQMNTLRMHALGNFGDMLKAISRDVAMIRYLNNQQNVKDQPNENYARELLELFTVGRGNYTETDIREAARAFTGWSSNFFGDYVFRKRQHDYGDKTFFGRTGKFDGDDIIDIILEQKACADFIASKVYRYFVSTETDPGHIEELSNVFYESEYNIAAMMNHLLKADWFYSDAVAGRKIKSPVELMAGMMCQLQVGFTNATGLNLISKALGQQLFRPPNVAGWPGGKSWINNATLLTRMNLGHFLFSIQDRDIRQEFKERQEAAGLLALMDIRIDLEPITKALSGLPVPEKSHALCDYLLAVKTAVPIETLTRGLAVKSEEEQVKRLILRITSLPEYQMC